SIKGGMTFNVKPAKPEVGTSLTVAGLQTQKMVESSMPIARNTVKGAISATLNIGGSGLNQSDIIAGWKGNGSMDIKDAIFSTLDVGTQVKAGVIDKLPGAIRSKANIPDKLLDKQGKYQNVGVKFALNSGVMNINEINGKAYPDAGLDLKGNGSVKLANYGLDLTLDIIDTYNMLRLDNEVKDQRYGHFAVSPKVGGTLFEPKFDWGATLGKLLESAARQQLATRGKEELKKHLPGAAGGLLDKITGGGGGNNNNNTNPSPTQKPAEAVGKALKGLFGH
ncbi:MAG: hypothetical protein HY075_14530, partial [Deltaproteobacteria bacterium]|nr:hypothetical protein [Deltaproteobacteria bacterium]